MDLFRKMRNAFGGIYLETSELAVDYNSANDIEVADSCINDIEEFDVDEQMMIRTISTQAWQFICEACKQEGLTRPGKVAAILQDIGIAHYG